MSLAPDALLLAADSASVTQAGVGTIYIVAIVLPILTFACTIVGLIFMSKRQPPVAEEMYRTFVTKSEQRETVERIDHTVATAFSEINAMRNQLSKAYGDFERALGRLEGSLEGLPCHKINQCPPKND